MTRELTNRQTFEVKKKLWVVLLLTVWPRRRRRHLRLARHDPDLNPMSSRRVDVHDPSLPSAHLETSNRWRRVPDRRVDPTCPWKALMRRRSGSQFAASGSCIVREIVERDVDLLSYADLDDPGSVGQSTSGALRDLTRQEARLNLDRITIRSRKDN